MNRGYPSIEREIFNKTVNVTAPSSHVWRLLTTPELIQKWMMPDIDIHIITDWTVGSPMIIRGSMNGKNFENRGLLIQFEPERTLRYSHLSSVSRLPDQPENYSIIAFQLRPVEHQTILDLTVSNFPTESIHQHLAFYWNVTLEVLKRMAEEQDKI